MVEVEGERGDMTVCKSRKNTNPERGASLVEYALLVALLCVVAVGGVRAVGVGWMMFLPGLTRMLNWGRQE
jgi:Flp pilus assembly pilin Flp